MGSDEVVVELMTDFSPELLAARERLLAGIMATWQKTAHPFSAAQPLVSPLYPLTIPAVEVVVERYRQVWIEAQAEKAAALAEAVASKRSPGDGYWKREHRARALYATALALLEALE